MQSTPNVLLLLLLLQSTPLVHIILKRPNLETLSMEPTKEKENEHVCNFNIEQTELNIEGCKNEKKKRSSPLSSLSASESEEEDSKGIINQEIVEEKNKKCKLIPSSDETSYQLPTLKIKTVLTGKMLSFPVHPRLTLIDLKDFILFTLNIPHPQQVLSFRDENDNQKLVILSNFSENTLLCGVPGLIDEVTGRCAQVGLSFKMASGIDFTIQPSDLEYDTNSETSGYFGLGEDEGFFEISSSNEESSGKLLSSDKDSKISALASSLASIIPLPPGVTKSSKMLFRSLSKTSPTNSNLPTLWEIYFPESGIKMMVTALINVSEVPSESKEKTEKDVNVTSNAALDIKNTAIVKSEPVLPESCTEKKIPALIITPEEETAVNISSNVEEPLISSSPSTEPTPKNNCEKCKIRCRPALRFICKCKKTFCQSHRYPDQHDCTYDHRAEGLASIQANNPKIVKDKISNF